MLIAERWVPRSATNTRRFSDAAAAGSNLRAVLGYCVQQTKEHDYENYLWWTQLSKASRYT